MAADEPAPVAAEAIVAEDIAEHAEQSPSPAAPQGRKHCIDGIVFYEPWPGYYEVWIGDRAVGEVERLNTGLPPTHRNSRGQFRATVYATEQSYNYEDIYAAVRALARRVAETC